MFQTCSVPVEATAIAPDGSEVRVLLATSRGGMALFEFPGRRRRPSSGSRHRRRVVVVPVRPGPDVASRRAGRGGRRIRSSHVRLHPRGDYLPDPQSRCRPVGLGGIHDAAVARVRGSSHHCRAVVSDARLRADLTGRYKARRPPRKRSFPLGLTSVEVAPGSWKLRWWSPPDACRRVGVRRPPRRPMTGDHRDHDEHLGLIGHQPGRSWPR